MASLQADILNAATIASRAIERSLGLAGNTSLARSQDLTLMLVLLIGEHLAAMASDEFASAQRGKSDFDTLAQR